MKRLVGLFIFGLMIIGGNAMAQSKSAAQGKITGRVVDAKSGEAIEYASVVLLKTTDSSMVGGGSTSENGAFNVSAPYGTYLLRVTFMGYNAYFHPTKITLSAKKNTIALGKLLLTPSATMMQEVVVTAERSMVEYQLDKRVINVDKNIVSGGGTATDILENVPSVAIDNDGNVTLRGSTNVKVLIDGKPSELLSSDLETLLEQIPASTVENIEVITNPSAKYDPEGMSGIINIKLKDRSASALGLNGIVNANFGAPLPFAIPDGLPKFIPNGMGSVNLNYTTEKYNLFFNLDGGTHNRANHSESFIQRRQAGSLYESDSLFRNTQHGHYMTSVKLGGEYYFDSKTSLLLSYQLRMGQRRNMNTTESHDIFNSFDSLDYTQTDTSTNRNRNHTINLGFIKKFDKPDQVLDINVAYSHRTGTGDGDQEQIYNRYLSNQNFYYLRETETENSGNNVIIQANYTHPFGDKFRLETGYEGRIFGSDQNYNYYLTTYESGNLVREYDDISSTHYDYTQNIHAIYATLGAKLLNNLSAQAGLRGEYSNIDGKDREHSDSKPIYKEYWELYPTLHLSYELNQDNSFQLSYSRRVRRPRMRDLNPYLDIREGQELSFGNPGTDPEFTDAFELSYNFGYKKLNIFSSAYYRQTNNMMTRYGFLWDADNIDIYAPWMVYNSEYDGYWATTWQNLNKGLNYGFEFIVDYQLFSWWKLNISVNIYQQYIEGTELLGGEDRDAFRASGKFSSFMKLPSGWTIQVSGQYRARFMDLQSEMYAMYWADLAVKKDILQKRGTISLRIGDVFCTSGFGSTTDSPQMYRTFHSKRISPTVMLGFSYKINHGLKQQQHHHDDEEDDEGHED
ncbi:MAG: TonB-dependent receptor [Bacteroidales bacterium]|nr:TonB-dependent receptor [Candidatus Colimorpha onthohippi]